MAFTLHRLFFSLKIKFYLAGLSLLAIPWVGYQYISEMEHLLQSHQEQTLKTSANVLANTLAQQKNLILEQPDATQIERSDNAIYAYPLHTPIQLDGYFEDWSLYQSRTKHYPSNVISNTADKDISFEFIAGTHDNHLYLYIHVTDDRLIYPTQENSTTPDGDHIMITTQNNEQYLLSTISPGRINIRPALSTPIYTLGTGDWKESTAGYNVELRIPLNNLEQHFAISIIDIDNKTSRKVETTLTTASKNTMAGNLLMPSPRIKQITHIHQEPGMRIWVINNHNRVLSASGQLKTSTPGHRYNDILLNLYRIILSTSASKTTPQAYNLSTLTGKAINQALQGESAIQSQAYGRDTIILSAVQPIFSDHQVIGAVVIEKSNHDILGLQSRALIDLINISLVVFLTVSLILFTTATVITQRIKHLRDETENSITADGRILKTPDLQHAMDEVGDLSRSFNSVFQRLSQYNHYLESMAGKLAHELRTPIAIIKSSLENVTSLETPKQIEPYLDRAQEGVNRMSKLVSRMSEASRLEKSLNSVEKKTFDLAVLLTHLIQNYQQTYPNHQFKLSTPCDHLNAVAAPDLIIQALDNIIANAVDFSPNQAKITLTLNNNADGIYLSIFNPGSSLPENMKNEIFCSMVSIRNKSSASSHLGLGLYIVKLIADYHQASLWAQNKAPSGVEFVMVLPH